MFFKKKNHKKTWLSESKGIIKRNSLQSSVSIRLRWLCHTNFKFIYINDLIVFQGSKSFIVTIKNPSIGAKIGKTATIVCHINKGKFQFHIDEKGG